MKKLIVATTLALLIATTALAQLGGGLFNLPVRTVRHGTADPSACTTSRDNIFYRTDLGQLKLCTAANTWTGVTTAGGTYLAADGTAAAPSYSFSSTGNGDNGMYLFAANAVGWSTAGTARWVINASGALVAATDGGVDIGNGASDPRDLNLKRSLILRGSTSGTTTVNATAIAGTTTLTLPAATDTLVGKATSDTLSNKTLAAPAIDTITTLYRITTAATAAPTLSSTGFGASPTLGLGAGSSELSGRVNITPGAGASTSGTLTLTFGSAYGANSTTAVAMLSNNTGTWNSRATLINSNSATTTAVFAWDNNSVAPTAGVIYSVNYVVLGR
jgi:hypothetical protein